MAVQGTVKIENESSYVKKYGFGLFEILGMNLTNEQLKAEGFPVRDEDLEKEREFVTEKEGVDVVRLEFACKEVKQENPILRKISFFVENTDKESVNNPGSFQWINNQGNTSYDGGKGEEGLQDWFKNERDVRKAKSGEAEFMDFMRNCMSVDFKEGGVLQYDISKFFKGNWKELKEDLKSDFLSTVIVALTIKEKDVDVEGEMVKKEYENFYNKAFAPGSQWKFLQNKKEFSEADVVKLHEKVAKDKEIMQYNKENPTAKKKREWLSPLEKMVVSMTDEQYPCKDRYYLGMNKEYVASEDFVGSGQTLTETDY